MGWTSSENLVCILEEGTMVVYDLRGEQVFARVIARVSIAMSVYKQHDIIIHNYYACHCIVVFVRAIIHC